MERFTRVALIAVATIVFVAGICGRALTVFASPHPIDVPRPTTPIEAPVRATPPPLPLNVLPSAVVNPNEGETLPLKISGSAVTFHVNKALASPPRVHKLSEYLQRVGRGTYAVRTMPSLRAMSIGSNAFAHTMSASGSTIIMTGNTGAGFTENDVTMSYGSGVYFACTNMRPNSTYTYVAFPPNGSGPYQSSSITTDGSGNCESGGNVEYGALNLSTPFNGWGTFSQGTDPSYAGVWTLLMHNSGTNQYETQVNVVVGSTIHFDTYSDPARSTAAIDFTQGSSIVAFGSGLNPSHNYAVGWVYTAVGNQPCTFRLPGGASTNTGVCFQGATSGTAAIGGQLTALWGPTSTPSTSTASTGTYVIELYDATSNDYISTQQVSVEGSSAAWTLTPYNQTLGTGANLNDTFATDGLTDQSVSGLNFTASGLPASSNGHAVRLVVSDPNGVVLGQPQNNGFGAGGSNYPQFAPFNSTTSSGGAVSYSNVAFPLSTTYSTAYGPTQTPFAPNVFTAQLYDTTSSSVIASKSFRILGYGANVAWNSGSVISGSSGGAFAPYALTVTNNGNQNFGLWNDDGIAGLRFSGDGASVSLALGSTSAVDSAGNTWNLSQTGTGVNAVITAIPATAGAALPPTGTISFNIQVAVQPGAFCNKSPCTIPTQILPQHGIAFSAQDSVTPALLVVQNGVPTTNVTSTYSWAITGESSTANMAARLANFKQATYISGTAGSPTSDSYQYTLVVNNNDKNRMMDIEFVFPPTVDVNSNTPSWISQPSGWYIMTKNMNPSLAGPNVLELTCFPSSMNGCGIKSGSSQTFTLNIPLFQSSFAPTDISATGNFDGGGCGSCTASSFNVVGNGNTSNTIAGYTNVDSISLAAFSLNPVLMKMVFSPNSIGAVAGASSTLTFTNTATSADAAPDYVDQINLSFPTGSRPSSITVPSPWIATQTSAGNWTIAFCTSPTNATPCATSEPSALGAGQSLAMTVNYATAPTAGSYNVGWSVVGANIGEDTKNAASTTPLTITATSASEAFTSVNGVSVSGGAVPSVGTDATASGSTFVYTITNTGATTIDQMTITIPGSSTISVTAKDSGGTVFSISSASVALSAGSSGTASCSGTIPAAQITNATPPSNGSIVLTGCTLKPLGTATITFTTHAPYMIGNNFQFTTQVHSGTTWQAAAATYNGSDALQIIIDGRLTVLTPNAGSIGGGNPLVASTGSGAAPSTACVNCSVIAGTPNTVDFGAFSGTFTGSDVVDASVNSDANNPNNWVLYITAGTNPSNMLSTKVDSATSTVTSGFTVNQGTMGLVPTSSPGLQLSTYNGTARHSPIDSIMSYQVATGGNTSPQTVTVTYTLVFN